MLIPYLKTLNFTRYFFLPYFRNLFKRFSLDVIRSQNHEYSWNFEFKLETGQNAIYDAH